MLNLPCAPWYHRDTKPCTFILLGQLNEASTAARNQMTLESFHQYAHTIVQPCHDGSKSARLSRAAEGALPTVKAPTRVYGGQTAQLPTESKHIHSCGRAYTHLLQPRFMIKATFPSVAWPRIPKGGILEARRQQANPSLEVGDLSGRSKVPLSLRTVP